MQPNKNREKNKKTKKTKNFEFIKAIPKGQGIKIFSNVERRRKSIKFNCFSIIIGFMQNNRKLAEKIILLEKMDGMLEKSKLTEADTIRLGRKVKRACAKKFLQACKD